MFQSQYRKNAHYNSTHRRRQNLYALPSAQWQMLAAPPFSILDTLNAVDDALDYNADLADAIFQLGLASFGLDEKPGPSSKSSLDWRGKAKPNDVTKAHSTIRQFYRDWSHEGFTREVEPLLRIVLSDLEGFLATDETQQPPPQQQQQQEQQRYAPNNNSPQLLLPGAGLGRLLFELCLRGYNATGNEISYHQLLASNLILNGTRHADQFAIYPFANTFTNVTSRANQLRRYTVPDVHPGEALSARARARLPVGEMNMTAGDFVLSYSTPECAGMFDGVVTVFFIDTAPNLIRYVETVRNCLREGGVWINVGPLLWHFDDRMQRGAGGGEEEEDEDDEEEQDEEEGHSHSHSHPHAHSHPHDSDASIPSARQRSRRQKRSPLDLEDKGIGEPGSVELTDEEVTALVSRLGFEIVRHEIVPGSNASAMPGSEPASRSGVGPEMGTGIGIGYMQDPHSLLQNLYRCSHWVARRKKIDVSAA